MKEPTQILTNPRYKVKPSKRRHPLVWGTIKTQRNKPLEERFWEKVNKDGPIPKHTQNIGQCWIWMAMINGMRRPIFCVNGGRVLAYRVAWKITFGEIPNGLQVCHKCDNSICCNPSHLFLGTHLQNMQDMYAKKRHGNRKGENSGKSKITEQQAKEIKNLLAAGVSIRKIENQFPIGRGGIWCIKNGETWTHI